MHNETARKAFKSLIAKKIYHKTTLNILTKTPSSMSTHLKNFWIANSCVLIMFLDCKLIEQLIQNFLQAQILLPSNLTSKNAFTAVCIVIDPNKDLELINSQCEYGGLIGPGNSKLNSLLKCFKLFCLHAAFHDAFGFKKQQYNIGPGYVYTFGQKPLFKNNCFLGHFTGLYF